ncbi:RrF2 family transcriptional regulator [Synechococcus elongatus]|uniref:Rrf2 family transcriptional regulator n=2 Tax=Synechococcus elongatus TaxID=32046 RepID=A0AAN1QNI0_SYNEL|nr:Rrf2 family transcriptional regulator [Synechococcus elongatus]AZB72584.1 transcriptional regulator [Synechococcus elongatus PCC 11801]QFZ92762.1 Rrf2 family transcriptional regulator [Synechococcus elongatus PCC 11802]
MELSGKCEYALLALIELARGHNNGEPQQIKQLAEKQNIPDRYLEQLLATLRRGGIVRSVRGARGGYLLAREPWQISMQDVVYCIDGAEPQRIESTDQQSVTIERQILVDINHELCKAAEDVLAGYSLQDLLEIRENRASTDLMYYI